MKTNRNLLVTGMAGTGKTRLIKEYLDWAKEQGLNVVVTASTGIAAVNIGGITINKFLGCGSSGSISHYQYYIKDKDPQETYERIREVDCIIIDEVSMLNSGFIDMIDYILVKATKINEQFGGKRIIFVGDFLQLPPVGGGSRSKHLAFSSSAWKRRMFPIYNLRKVYRQDDEEFIDILRRIRFGDNRPYLDEYFSDLQIDDPFDILKYISYTRLCATNEVANNYNMMYLDILDDDLSIYPSLSTEDNGGRKTELTSMVQDELLIKLGARVIAIVNDLEGKYVNGSLGFVSGLEDDYIIVNFDNGNIVKVKRVIWKDDNLLIKQFPLKLAYAMTIHKSQGLTLDKVIVECDGIFDEGQFYVAVSRCKSREGLLLNNFDADSQIKANREAIRFYMKYEDIEVDIIDNLNNHSIVGYDPRRMIPIDIEWHEKISMKNIKKK